MNRLRLRACAALALCSLAAGARADSCSASMTDVVFGQVSTISGSDVYAGGTLSVTCSWTLLGGLPPLLLFPNVSVCANLTTSPRVLANGGNQIAFELYRDNSYAAASVWGGPATPASPTPFTYTSGGLLAIGSVTRQLPVYGKIAAAALAGGVTSGGNDAVYTASLAGNIRYSFYGLLSPVPACTASGASAAFSFAAQATVTNNCVINTQALAFGPSGMLSSAVRATATLQAQCTSGNPYRIALNGGSVSGNSGDRRMKNTASAETIGYRISATLDGPLWGDGSNGTSMLSATGSGQVQGITLYGVVPAQATPAPGDYKDTVLATIYF